MWRGHNPIFIKKVLIHLPQFWTPKQLTTHCPNNSIYVASAETSETLCRINVARSNTDTKISPVNSKLTFFIIVTDGWDRGGGGQGVSMPSTTIFQVHILLKHFSVIFVFYRTKIKKKRPGLVILKILMARFEPRSSGVWSDTVTNCAKTSATTLSPSCPFLHRKVDRGHRCQLFQIFGWTKDFRNWRKIDFTDTCKISFLENQMTMDSTIAYDEYIAVIVLNKHGSCR